MRKKGFPARAAGIFLRGCGMGIADLVPGVSGATIALLSGIYERLVVALSSLAGPGLWRLLLRGAWRDFLRHGDLPFLALLVAGIFSSVLLCVGLLKTLLETRLHLILAFFFGLVLASAGTVARRLRYRPPTAWPFILLGVLPGLAIALSPPLAAYANPGGGLLFLGGAISICAMLLPGISGSYVLLLLGIYPAFIGALQEKDVFLLGAFAGGCTLGLLAFIHFLRWLLRRFHDPTLLVVIGVLIGGLPRLWPWKQQAAGMEQLLQPNLSPAAFQAAVEPPQVLAVLLLFLAGVLLTLVVDTLGHRFSGASSRPPGLDS